MIESERETAFLLESETMRRRLLAAKERSEGIDIETPLRSLQTWKAASPPSSRGSYPSSPRSEDRTSPPFASDALGRALDYEDRSLREVEKGRTSLCRGEFVDHDELKAWIAKRLRLFAGLPRLPLTSRGKLDPQSETIYRTDMDIQLSREQQERIEKLAAERGADPSTVLSQMVAHALEYEEWFSRGVDKGFASIDRGEFVDQDDLEAEIEQRLNRK